MVMKPSEKRKRNCRGSLEEARRGGPSTPSHGQALLGQKKPIPKNKGKGIVKHEGEQRL